MRVGTTEEHASQDTQDIRDEREKEDDRVPDEADTSDVHYPQPVVAPVPWWMHAIEQEDRRKGRSEPPEGV
jgi:hypothetical protein